MLLGRNLLIIGGSGNLGKAITERFAKKNLVRWKVLNIDFTENKRATQNIVLKQDQDLVFNEQAVEEIKNKAKSFAEEFDAIICAAGSNPKTNIADFSIFEDY